MYRYRTVCLCTGKQHEPKCDISTVPENSLLLFQYFQLGMIGSYELEYKGQACLFLFLLCLTQLIATVRDTRLSSRGTSLCIFYGF